MPHDELPAVPPPAKPRRRRAAKAEPTREEPRTVEAADEAIGPAPAPAGHDDAVGRDEPAATAEPARDETPVADAAEAPVADAAEAEPAAAPEREARPPRRRRGARKRTSDEPAARRAPARDRQDEPPPERMPRQRPRPLPVPDEPLAETDEAAYPACRIKFHNRPIRTHFYAVPYEGGPVLARSPYFKLERGAGEPGPTAPEALRALVEQLNALGWQQTGVGSAPWDLRFQRSARVVQRRG